ALDNSSVAQRLQEIDVLLLPSHWEGFPWTLIEAMAAGCVPIASRIKGVTDWILRDGEAGMLCDIGDVGAFANAIESLASDRQRFTKLSSAARQQVEERYNFDQFSKAWAALFSRVAAEPIPLGRRSDVANLRIIDHSTWRRFLPDRLKGRLRGLLERL